ncbi:MAG: fructose-6-phosphate aldolase [Myxococcota bacterium]
MKFFLDTAHLPHIREAAKLGLVDGITTNPSLLSREEGDPREVVREIAKLVPGPISAEVVSLDADGMVREGLEWAKVAENIVVKIPMCLEGLKAIGTLAEQDVATNCTLIFSPIQALMAAKAGASMISPFVGRLDDIQAPGMELIALIVEIFANYEIGTEVLVASIRNPVHVVEAARMGADIATMPWAVFQSLANHPLTDIGIERFLADWEKIRNRG